MKYRVLLAYEGTAYAGWQEQRTRPTIQGELNQALERLDRRSVVTHAAGRTDAGVHAEGQVVSFRLGRVWDSTALVRAINANLPRDIRVCAAEPAAESFHPRLDAVRKTYRYRLVTAAVLSPFMRRYAMHYPFPLDPARLERDAAQLVGRHDFRAFTVTERDTRTTVRTIERVALDWEGGSLEISFTGNGFLRYQVRAMVGALLDFNMDRLGRYAGAGVQSMTDLIARGDRNLIGGAAPAHGLTLVKVEY